MNRVLVITTEPLPVPGGLTTGAGLRAWGLAEGLRSRGFDVTIATPLEGEQALSQSAKPTDERVFYFVRADLGATIAAIAPDVIVMQHWGLMYAVPPVECPIAIDLAGPHLLERQYWGNRDSEGDLREKLAALRRADFVVCGGEFQRHYFYPYLALAGFDLTQQNLPVIPFSVPPAAPTGHPAAGAEATFVYGGAFLAWQNPEKAIRWLLDEMDIAGSGRLLFYGGAHPTLDASGGRFLRLYQFLREHPRVEMRGWRPFAELAEEYASEGHVALDLMERNPERELAYTTRTMVYLWCGLPVIYNNYSEISALIQREQCGWVLDPEDESGFRRLVQGILRNPATALSLRERAQAAALKQNWNATIGPLADFCAAPYFRPDKLSGGAAGVGAAAPCHSAEMNAAASGTENVPAEQSFSSLKGKLAANLLYLPVWVLSKGLNYYHRL